MRTERRLLNSSPDESVIAVPCVYVARLAPYFQYVYVCPVRRGQCSRYATLMAFPSGLRHRPGYERSLNTLGAHGLQRSPFFLPQVLSAVVETLTGNSQHRNVIMLEVFPSRTVQAHVSGELFS